MPPLQRTIAAPSQAGIVPAVHAPPPPLDVQTPFTQLCAKSAQSVDICTPLFVTQLEATEPAHVADAAEHVVSPHSAPPVDVGTQVEPDPTRKMSEASGHAIVERTPPPQPTRLVPSHV